VQKERDDAEICEVEDQMRRGYGNATLALAR
jgi:hypothetical protein